MKCPKCNAEIRDTANFCDECGSPVRPAPPRDTDLPAPLVDLLPFLPHIIAVPLLEYARETVPYVKLHRMCDASELLARFAATVLLADLLRRGNGQFPREKNGTSPLEGILARHLTAPTFGSWRVILEAALEHYPRGKEKDACFVAGMPDLARAIVRELGSNADDPHEKLIPCRNLAAHSGRMPDDEASRLLEAHHDRLEELFRCCRFLSDYPLVAQTQPGGLINLMGTAIPTAPVEPSPPAADQAKPGRLCLLLPDGEALLDLSPLHTYQPVRVRTESEFREAQKPSVPVPQVYFRAERDLAYLEYLTFATAAPHGQEAHDALAHFKDVFNLEEWRRQAEAREEVEVARQRFTFRRLRDSLLTGFVGRGECLKKMTRVLKDKREGGIVWMTGKAGSGKSALIAKFLEDGLLGINDLRKWVTIFHFFRAQEGPTCSRGEFLRNALSKLLPECGIAEDIEEDPRKREDQFAQVLGQLAKKEAERSWPPQSKEEARRVKPPFRRGLLFLLDGLDELTVSDPGFPDFILRHRVPGVVWFCAGQPLEALQRALSPSERCRHVFPPKAEWDTPDERDGGVPRMTRNEVYEYLMSQCRASVYELMNRDGSKPVGQDSERRPLYPNAFLDTLVEKSEGLPLYLHLVAQDIREGRLTFREGQEHNLPGTLREYYDRLLERMSVGDLKAVMTPMVMRLAVAKGPLTADALHAFLQNVEELRGPEGRELLEEALAFGHVMLRRAALPLRKGEETARLGYTIYHGSFQEHLLDPNTKASREPGSGAGATVEEETWTCPELVEVFSQFVSAHIYTLHNWPCDAVTMAYNYAAGGPVGREVHGKLQQRPYVSRPWLSRINRPPFANRPACLRVLEGHNGSVNAVAISPDARLGISASADRTLRVWELPSGRCLHTLEGHGGEVEAVALSPDVHQAVSVASSVGGRRRRRRIWDLASGRGVHAAQAAGVSEYALISLKAQLAVLTGCDDGRLRILDLASGRCLRTLEGHSEQVVALALSPDARLGVSASSDRTLRVWDIASGDCVHILEGHNDWIAAVSISREGHLAVSGSSDKTLRVWDLASGRRLAIYPAPAPICALSTVAASRVVAGDEAGQVHLLALCNIDQGPPILTAIRHGGALGITCPQCRSAYPVENLLGQQTDCPSCGAQAQIAGTFCDADASL